MPKTQAATEPSRNTLNPALLALKPRQLLISKPVMAKALSLKSEQKALLIRSIALYLERCGFSKCFKKLLSEAEIEKKELNSALPDLEEVYSVFLNKSHVEAVEVKDESADGEEKKKSESDDHEMEKNKQVAEVSAMEGVEKVKKKKKKKEMKVEVTKEEKVKETDVEIEEGVKEKKKKKKESKAEVTKEDKVKETDAEVEDGVKEKKKKKNKLKSTEAETLGDEEKVSKKRKRSEPEEETENDEESKRRKKEENVAEDDMNVQETPLKETADVQENGNFEKSETKSTNKKSGKELSNSKEPKKPFQRVNVEEVVFTDDRLKDNSYWAKDGADSGYGAKAQEVLGQVRGRGFRHEKTKKKRGSYRGGEIDLQSHSVKFEYSDDE